MAAQGALWSNQVFSGVFISLIGFGPGRISGVMGHRTAQHDHPQHDLRAGALPRHGGGRDDAVVHGADLALIPVLFKREMIAPGLAKVPAVPVRPVDVLLLSGHDGRRYAGRVAPALGLMAFNGAALATNGQVRLT